MTFPIESSVSIAGNLQYEAERGKDDFLSFLLDYVTKNEIAATFALSQCPKCDHYLHVEESRQQRIYNIILKMVLWGEPREKVFKTLETNGFTSNDAQELYARAFKERLDVIRSTCWKKATFGFAGIAAGILVILLHQRMVLEFGVAHFYLYYTGIIIAATGLFFFADAMVKAAAAPHKKGPVSDD